MTDKQIIIDGVDVIECPAMNTYNIFGIEDKPCCYKFHEYCSTIPNCYFKKLKREKQNSQEAIDTAIKEFNRAEELKTLLKRKEQKLENIKEICNEYQKEYILNIGVEILTNEISQIIKGE